jgi:hypothetical protein
MALVTLAFQFSQRFPFSAAEVYRWATNYQPGDIGLLGKQGRRGIAILNDDTVMLTDVFVTPDGGRVTKKKLIRLYPAHQRWTNTHVSGPNKHSQFLYQLVSMGKHACRLEFTGAQLLTVDKQPSAASLRAQTEHLLKEDKAMWKGLARALAADLKR